MMNKDNVRRLDFEVFMKPVDSLFDYFMFSVNEDRKNILMINDYQCSKVIDSLDLNKKLIFKQNLTTLEGILDKEILTQVDRMCVIDLINALELTFKDVTVKEYKTTIIEEDGKKTTIRELKGNDVDELEKPVQDLQNELDEDSIEDEYVLVDEENGFILAYLTSDVQGECYDLVLSDCKPVQDYLDEEYSNDIMDELRELVGVFNDSDIKEKNHAYTALVNIQRILKEDYGMGTVLKDLSYEIFTVEDNIPYSKRLNLGVYASTDKHFEFLAEIMIRDIGEDIYSKTVSVDYENVNRMINLGFIDGGISLEIDDIDEDDIDSIHEFIDEMNERNISVIVNSSEKKECLMFLGEDDYIDEDEVLDDDNNEEDEDMISGFVIKRVDTQEVVATAFIKDDDSGYEYHANNMYIVSKRFEYEAADSNEFVKTIEDCNNKVISLHDTVAEISKLNFFNDIGLEVDVMLEYDPTSSFMVNGEFLTFLLMDDVYNDTIGQLTFNKLNPMFHGEAKVSVSKSLVTTTNVNADMAMLAKPTFDRYYGIMDMKDVDLNLILSELTNLGNFSVIINMGGKCIMASKPVDYQQPSAVYKDDGSNAPININPVAYYGKSMDELFKPRKIQTSSFYGETEAQRQKATNKNKGSEKKITFKDVIGMTEVKEKLYDVIDQMKNKEKYIEWDIKPIRGVLLHGPSGTGKSYISEALANEVDAKFIKKSAGDIVSKYIGESGKNIKKLFDEARNHKGNTIIFIDEVDAIASKRSGEDNNKERNSTLNELLVQMSSQDNDNIFMIFATNLEEVLDPAFLRSGRCDFKIEVPLPDFEMRKGILESTSKKRPLADDVDFDSIARNMSGMNCADVSHLSNEAARIALKAKKSEIERADYDKAYEDMICGSSSKTTKLEDDEKRMTAIHEIGHFFMNHKLDLRKAKKISILPRGSALGFVLYANEDKDDKFISTKEELEGQIMTLLAGRASEEVMLGYTGTGASNDLERANKVARNIVCKYAFNGSLLVYDENDIMSRPMINEQVSQILDKCYKEVKNTLEENKEVIQELSDFLYNKEDVTGDELVEIINQFDGKLAVLQQ